MGRRDEIVDEGFWGSPRRARLPLSGSYVVDGLALAGIALVIATIVGVVLLWPHGKLSRESQSGPIKTVCAVAERVESAPCKLSASGVCRLCTRSCSTGRRKDALHS